MRRSAMLDPRVLVLVHLVEDPLRRIVFLLKYVEPETSGIAFDRSRRVVENGRSEFAEQLGLDLHLDQHNEHGRTILRACLRQSASSDSVSWVAGWRPRRGRLARRCSTRRSAEARLAR